MAVKEKRKPKRPKGGIIGFRLSDKAMAALEAERSQMGVMTFSLADCAREILVRTLKERGRL